MADIHVGHIRLPHLIPTKDVAAALERIEEATETFGGRQACGLIQAERRWLLDFIREERRKLGIEEEANV